MEIMEDILTMTNMILVYFFQRTSNYAVPAHNRELDPKEVMNFKKNYKENKALAKTLVSGNSLVPRPAKGILKMN